MPTPNANILAPQLLFAGGFMHINAKCIQMSSVRVYFPCSCLAGSVAADTPSSLMFRFLFPCELQGSVCDRSRLPAICGLTDLRMLN